MKRLTLFAVCELLSANKALWFYPFSSLFLFDDGISKTLHTEGATCRNLPESSFFLFLSNSRNDQINALMNKLKDHDDQRLLSTGREIKFNF